MTVLVFLDKLANVLLFRSRKWVTISARVGYAASKGRAWGVALSRVLDAIFGAGHCLKTAQDEGLIP